MRELFEKLKIPFIIIAVLVALLIIYNTFIKQPAPTNTSLLSQTTQSNASAPDRDFLPLLQQVQNVNLDQTLFNDPVFRALHDGSQVIVPESVGRQNPFSGQLVGPVNSTIESLGFTETKSSATTQTNTPVTPVKKTTTKTTK